MSNWYPIICLTSVISLCGFANAAAQAELAKSDVEPEAVSAEVESIVDQQTLQYRFENGYKAYLDKDYSKSSELLFHFIQDANEETLNKEWGAFFLGLSYQKLGFQYASVDVFAHLLGQKPNPEIVTEVLTYFEKLSFTESYDQELMIDYGVVNQDFGFIDAGLQNFVNYQQGIYNWRVGMEAWGNQNFSLIDRTSIYYPRVVYQKALRDVYRGEIDSALEKTTAILASSDVPEDLILRTELLAARLYFEQRNFELAIPLFTNAVAQGNGTSPVLLELAWSHYLMGDREKALGLLYAFQAPSYRRLLVPEYFILKAHIYKDVCYYDAAQKVSIDFHDRYQQSLDAMYAREQNLSASYSQLHLPLLSRMGISRYWQLLQRLQLEQVNLGELQWSEDLSAHLTQLYQLKIDSTTWRLQQVLSDHFEQIANQTLVISEEMDLIEYELGVQRYQNELESAALREEGERFAAQRKDSVVYPFQEEYWNDELDNFVINLESKCQPDEVWEQSL